MCKLNILLSPTELLEKERSGRGKKKVYFRIYERMRVIKIDFSARKNQGYRGNNEFLLSLILM